MGIKSRKFQEKLDPERIDLFCRAVKGKDMLSNPPTILTIFRAGEFELLDQIGIPRSRVLHGEQEYEFSGAFDLRAELLRGIEFESTIKNYREKKSAKGNLHFVIFETTFLTKDATLLAVARSNMVVRGDLS